MHFQKAPHHHKNLRLSLQTQDLKIKELLPSSPTIQTSAVLRPVVPSTANSPRVLSYSLSILSLETLRCICSSFSISSLCLNALRSRFNFLRCCIAWSVKSLSLDLFLNDPAILIGMKSLLPPSDTQSQSSES